MSTVIEPPVTQAEKHLEELETVTIRFAGDSGDGMQLTGTQFTNTSAVVGNDISTLPDFPAEIRAPAGSLPGVSGFQLNFSSQDIKAYKSYEMYGDIAASFSMISGSTRSVVSTSASVLYLPREKRMEPCAAV
jgi:hypothetical protein